MVYSENSRIAFKKLREKEEKYFKKMQELKKIKEELRKRWQL